jgi:hypothetical protein
MANWPFSRARDPETDPWRSGHRYPLNIVELWDSQVSQMADGRVWTDVAMLMNFYATSSINTGQGIGWIPPTSPNLTGYWVSMGVSAGNATAFYSLNGLTWTSLTIPAGAGLTPQPNAFAAKPDGSITVFGGTPGSSSASKYRRSTTILTWTAENSSQTDTAGVTSIAWLPFANLFVAGHTSGKLETSPNAQTSTWTNRTTPFGAVSIGKIAVSSTRAVAVAVNSTAAAYSTDGITWTGVTLPITCSGAVVYNTRLSKFYAFGTTGAGICSSSDGITWSSSGLTGPGGLTSPSFAVSSGRLIISSPGQGGLLAYSMDARRWKYIQPLHIVAPQGPAALAISTDGQMIVTDNGVSPCLHAVSWRSY